MDDQPKTSIISGFKLPIKIGLRPLMILGAVAILFVVGIGFWYWSKGRQALSPQTQETPTLGSEIFEKTQNPLKGKLPETNPFKEQKNPFDTIYQNPFK